MKRIVQLIFLLLIGTICFAQKKPKVTNVRPLSSDSIYKSKYSQYADTSGRLAPSNRPKAMVNVVNKTGAWNPLQEQDNKNPTPRKRATTPIVITVTLSGAPTGALSLTNPNLKFNKQGVFQMGFDHTMTVLDGAAYMSGGTAPTNGQTYSGKTYTDGANVRGRNLKYTSEMAVNAWWGQDSLTDASVNQQPTAAQYKPYILAGWTISNHGAFHGPQAGYSLYNFNTQKNLAANNNYQYRQYAAQGVPFAMRTATVPSNDTNYTQAAEQLGMLVSTSQNTFDNYPFTPNPEWSNSAIGDVTGYKDKYGFKVFARGFEDVSTATNLSSYKARINTLLAQSTPSVNKIMSTGVHSVDVVYFPQIIDYLYANSGDRIWVTSLQEMAEYWETIQRTAVTKSLSGNTLTITLDQTNIPAMNRWRDMSFILSGGGVTISSVTVTGADDYSYNTTNGLINVFKKNNTNSVAPLSNKDLTLNYNTKIPVVLDDFYQDNNFADRPTALIDGDINTAFNPSYQLIYLPHDVELDLRQYNAIINKVRLYDLNGSNFNTKIIAVRADNNQEVELGTYTGANYGAWDEFVAPTKFVASKLILRGGTGATYGNELEVIADYQTYVQPAYNRPKTPIKDLLGVNLHWWDTQNIGQSRSNAVSEPKMQAIAGLGLSTMRNYGGAYEYQPLAGKWAFNPVRQGWYEEDAVRRIKQLKPDMKYWSVLLGQFDHIKATWEVPDETHKFTGSVLSYTNNGSWGVLRVRSATNVGSGTFGKWIVDLTSTPAAGKTAANYHNITEAIATIPTVHPTDLNINVGGNLPYVAGDQVIIKKTQASQLNINYADNDPVSRGEFGTWDTLAHAAYVWASRKGTNPNAPKFNTWSTIDYDPSQTWVSRNNDSVGLGTAYFFEGMNEPNAFWVGYDDFLNGKYLGPAWSMMYDGHQGLYPNSGVKNADPNMLVQSSGLATNNADLVRGVEWWSYTHRKRNPDGTANLPFDVVQFHSYSYTGGLSQYAGGTNSGLPPELSNVLVDDLEWVRFSNRNGYVPIDIGEWGYDVNQGSPMNAAIYGPYNAEQTRRNWAIRTILEMNAIGINYSQWYRLYQDYPNSRSDVDATQFSTMALLREDETTHVITRTVVGNGFRQLSEYGNYVFDARLNAENPRVLRFKNGNSYFVAIWAVETSPNKAQWGSQKAQFTEVTGNYTLALPVGTAIKIRRFQDGGDVLSTQNVTTTGTGYAVTYGAQPIIIEWTEAGGGTNIAPTSNAGSDQTLTSPASSTTLSGGGNDPDGNISSYLWTKVSGTGGTITNPTNAITTVSGLTAGTYVFRLTVTDNQGGTSFDDVSVTVGAAPVVGYTRTYTHLLKVRQPNNILTTRAGMSGYDVLSRKPVKKPVKKAVKKKAKPCPCR